MDREQMLEAFCTAVNGVKKSAWKPADLRDDALLGGDLGIDSIEMLEVWYDLQRLTGVEIADDDKRDVMTVGQVLGVLAARVPHAA